MRWGRSACPLADSLVYSGLAAGNNYLNSGGGYNSLCLHNSPKYLQFNAATTTTGGRLYRAEFETSLSGVYDAKIIDNYGKCWFYTRTCLLS